MALAFKDCKTRPVRHMPFPEKGKTALELQATMAVLKSFDIGGWKSGKVFGYVYPMDPATEKIAFDAFRQFISQNQLDFTVFPSLLELENQVVSMTASLMNAPPTAAGSFTSGGTESLFLAVKTARDYAQQERGIATPEIILPDTAHAAFHKACHLLGMKYHLSPVGPDYRANVAHVDQLLKDNPNVVLIVGSACSYAHGVCDPIEELGELALKYNVLFHVDACIGGIVLQYFRRYNPQLPKFDMSVPGVTSLSVDLHKYAFCFKPASVLLYHDQALRYYQLYACSDWTGYTIINSTFMSTKSGGPMAGAWAVLNYMGDNGYDKLMKSMFNATEALVAGLENNKIPGLKLLAKPHSNLICFTTEGLSVFHLADIMKKKGWYIQPQLSYGNSPENIHLSINPHTEHKAAGFLRDLAESAEEARGKPSLEAKWGGRVNEIMEKFNTSESKDYVALYKELTGLAGISPDDLPDEMCNINWVLNHLDWQTREKILKCFMNDAFRFDKDTAEAQEKKFKAKINRALLGYFGGMPLRALQQVLTPQFIIGAGVGAAAMLAYRSQQK